MKRHWVMSLYNVGAEDVVYAATLQELAPSVQVRIPQVRSSAGGCSLSVSNADTGAELWRMVAGGDIAINRRSHYADEAAVFFGEAKS